MTHKELIDSAVPYALGALDPNERVAYESHLAGCRECQVEVAAYREVAASLAYASPPAAPPDTAGLRERILREARAVRPIGIAPRGAVSALPAQPLTAAPPRRPFAAWAVAAASLAAAAMLAFVYRGERETNARLRGELATAQTALARDDSTLAALVGPEVHVVSLAEPDRKPTVRVFWNHTRQTFVVTAFGLPPALPGKTYQLWALRKGQPPLSMGTFDVNASGRAMTTLAVTPAITDGGFIDDCALTVEPAGGSPQPTEAPRLIGGWRHVD